MYKATLNDHAKRWGIKEKRTVAALTRQPSNPTLTQMPKGPRRARMRSRCHEVRPIPGGLSWGGKTVKQVHTHYNEAEFILRQGR